MVFAHKFLCSADACVLRFILPSNILQFLTSLFSLLLLWKAPANVILFQFLFCILYVIYATKLFDCLQIKVVHVCEATLTKRLIEFENTESGSLTVCTVYSSTTADVENLQLY